MLRNFDPVRKQVDAWKKSELTEATAKVVDQTCSLLYISNADFASLRSPSNLASSLLSGLGVRVR